MRYNLGHLYRVSCALWAAGALLAHADNGWEGHILTLGLENDAIALSDRHYTQGATITYLSADHTGPRLLRSMAEGLPGFGYQPLASKWGTGFGQEIYTPEDLRSSAVVVDDRPYAGWLFGSFILQQRGLTGRGLGVMELLRLDLGVVGPESQAEATQKEWHHVPPEGWDHQLNTEIGAVLRYQRRYLWLIAARQSPWSAHIIPGFSANGGNIDTSFGLSVLTRVGYRIPNEFAVGSNPEGRGLGLYLFGRVEGRAVLHDIFLDGNTFTDSHQVDKKPLTGSVTGGVAFTHKTVEVRLSYTIKSEEFERQQTLDSYGTAELVWKF